LPEFGESYKLCWRLTASVKHTDPQTDYKYARNIVVLITAISRLVD